MPLLIRVEDFKGEVIVECDDHQGLLNSVLNYCYQNSVDFNVLKYIDLYDDTTFNSLQVKDLVSDIEFLMTQSQIMSNEILKFLSLVIGLCKEALREPHLYLKFYGD